MNKKRGVIIISLLVCLVLMFSGCGGIKDEHTPSIKTDIAYNVVKIENIPEFSGEAYIPVNDNIPDFNESDLVTESYEYYSQLDGLGRCGVTVACVGIDIMPTEKREGIGQVKPTGWHTVKYDGVDGKYLYNRCHLIGFQLTGENANKQNLITGTRYLNIEGMLLFENMVADYVKETKNHVMYRVTPIFNGDNLLANGVQMEGLSVEDGGEGICFNVYAYNVQPGIVIDYATGESYLDDKVSSESDKGNSQNETYILNIKSKKYHKTDCPLAKDIKDTNKRIYNGDIESLTEKGYTPCKNCNK